MTKTQITESHNGDASHQGSSGQTSSKTIERARTPRRHAHDKKGNDHHIPHFLLGTPWHDGSRKSRVATTRRGIQLWVPFLLLFVLGTLHGAMAAPPSDDWNALVALYNATSGPKWLPITWEISVDPCPQDGSDGASTWGPSVSCRSGRVVYVAVPGNGLVGTLSHELSMLSKLRTLNLLSNQITGSLPPEWGNMTALSYLYLDNNQITGSPPPEWGNMKSMLFLSLSFNLISGSFPREWGAMAAMQNFFVENNQISGSLPPEFGNMKALAYLYLNNNLITGSLPLEWRTMSAIHYLYLDNNQITGTLPVEWGNMKLWDVHLQSNQITGSLPPGWGNMTSLQYLFLHSNQITGVLPPQWGAMGQLLDLWLVGMRLSGSIPQSWAGMKFLRGLHLNGNSLSGRIPTFPSLVVLSLENNAFDYDSISSGFRYTGNELYLGGNNIQQLPTNFSSVLPNVMKLGLRSCGLSAILPTDFNAALKYLDIAHNNFTIPFTYDVQNFFIKSLDFVDVTPLVNGLLPLLPVVRCNGTSSSRVSPYVILPLSSFNPCFITDFLKDGFRLDFQRDVVVADDETTTLSLFFFLDLQGLGGSCDAVFDLIDAGFHAQVTPSLYPYVLEATWSGQPIMLVPTLGGVFNLTLSVAGLSHDVEYHISINLKLTTDLKPGNLTQTHITNAFYGKNCLSNAVMAVVNSTDCYTCPKHGKCDGSSVVRAESGYWRPKNTLLPFYPCELNGGCKRNDTDGTTCDPGYQQGSFLCSACEVGFYFSYAGTCEVCPAYSHQVMLVAVCGGFTVFYLTASVVMSMKRGEWTLSKFGRVVDRIKPLLIGIKLFLNHCILVGVLADAAAPVFLARSQEGPQILRFVQSTAAIGALDILRVSGCLYTNQLMPRLLVFLTILTSTLTFESMVSVMAAKCNPAVFPSVLYTIIGAVSVTVQAVYVGVVKSAAEAISTCVEFNFHNASDALAIPIASHHATLMSRELSVTCTSASDWSKYNWLLLMGWLTIFFIGCGVPIVLCLLYRRIQRLEGDEEASMVFSFLVRNFRRSSWFWEPVIMGRKMMGIVFVTVVPDTNLLQVLALYYLLWGALQLHRRPFRSIGLNRLEYVSLSLGFASVNVIMFIKSAPPDASRDLFFLCLVVAMNVIGLAAVIWYIAVDVRAQWNAIPGEGNSMEEPWIDVAFPTVNEYPNSPGQRLLRNVLSLDQDEILEESSFVEQWHMTTSRMWTSRNELLATQYSERECLLVMFLHLRGVGAMNEQRTSYELQQRWSALKEEAASRAVNLMAQQFELVVWVRDWEQDAALRACVVEEGVVRKDMNEMAVEVLEMVVRLARCGT